MNIDLEREEFYMLIMDPSICSDLAPIWQIIGWVLWVFKIVIPIVIIVFGMIDLGKAVVASKDDEIKKSVKSLVMRAIAGIIIFFVPTLVGAIFGLVGEFNENRDEYNVCQQCISDPGGVCGQIVDCVEDTTKKWDKDSNTCVSRSED